MRQSIGLNSVGNARELGGCLTADGKRVRGGVLLRTAALVKLSPEDAQRLEREYHLAAVVDFRTTDEQRHQPDPHISGAQNHTLSIMEMSDIPGVTDEALKRYLDTRNGGDGMALLNMTLEMDLIDEFFYVTLLTSERGRAGYRRFFRLLLELEEGKAILWHCTDGKDRTGLAAMLLLTALGVDRETILADYLLTNEYNARQLAMVQAAFAGRELNEHQRRMVSFLSGGVAEEFLNNAYAALEERWGSVEGYLEAELGVGAAERRALREKFLTDAG